MPRKASFEERKIIFVVRVCVLQYWRRLGSVMPGSGGVSALVMLLPKWGCGSPQNWKQSGSFNSWEKERDPHSPLISFSSFLSGPVKGPWSDQDFNNLLEVRRDESGNLKCRLHLWQQLKKFLSLLISSIEHWRTQVFQACSQFGNFSTWLEMVPVLHHAGRLVQCCRWSPGWTHRTHTRQGSEEGCGCPGQAFSKEPADRGCGKHYICKSGV